MKKIIRSLMLMAIASTLITSCSIEKRLHNTGYHITWNKSWKQQKNTAQPEQNLAIQENDTKVSANRLDITSTQKVESTVQHLSAISSVANESKKVESNFSVATTNNDVKIINHSTTPKTFQQIKHENDEIINATAAHKMNEIQRTNAGSGSSASGGMLVLMIILCLFPFINLIPVYMHDGGITLNFWITLILDILGALPGIIFSLLVVLDVVSL